MRETKFEKILHANLIAMMIVMCVAFWIGVGYLIYKAIELL